MTHLRHAMDFSIPLEVWSNGEFDFECGSRDGLDVDGELEFRELRHELGDVLASLGRANQLADLVRLEVVKALPREVLFLDLLHHFLGNLSELTQWTHRLPPVGKNRN